MKLVYPAIFTPCVKKEGFTVIVPDLPGCVSEGDSLIHAIEHGTDAAVAGSLTNLRKETISHTPSNQKDIVLEDDSFISLLVLVMDS